MDRYLRANAAFSKFSRNYMELKKSLPIRPSEMAVLNILSAFPGPHTCAMLARRLGVSRPMVTALLASLEKEGYITKDTAPDDRRACDVRLTAKAHELVQAAQAETNRHLNALIDAMGPADFDMLVSLTQRAVQVLEAERSERS